MIERLEKEIVEHGIISIDSVFRFCENPSELPAFLQMCKNKRCTVEFELENLICEPDGYLHPKGQEMDDFKGSLFVVSFVTYMSMFKEYNEKHLEYLSNLAKQGDCVKHIYTPKLVDVFSLPKQEKHEEPFNTMSGVYFIFTNDYKELLYIGKSKRRVWRRILRHIDNLNYLASYSGDYKYQDAGVKVIPFEIEEVDLMEKLYIKKYNPPMNTQYCDKKSGSVYPNYFDFIFSKVNKSDGHTA